MLTSTFNAFVNKQFQESFDTTLMRNKKNSLKKIKISCFFFTIKNFKKNFINQFFKASINFSINKTTTLIPRSRTIMNFTST